MARPRKYNTETKVVSYRIPVSKEDEVTLAVNKVLAGAPINKPIASKVEVSEEIKQLQREINSPPKEKTGWELKLYIAERKNKIKSLNQ